MITVTSTPGSTIRAAFAREEAAAAAVTDARKATDERIAPAIIAAKMVLGWMTFDKPPADLYHVSPMYASPPPLNISRGLSGDGAKVFFSIERCFPGSARHGSGDLVYEASFEVPLEMIERADLEELEAFIRSQCA